MPCQKTFNAKTDYQSTKKKIKQLETGKSSCTIKNISGATTIAKLAWCNYYYKLVEGSK